MASEVLRIPLIYFDTNHIIEMVRWRKGTCSAPMERIQAYAAISQAVTQGHVRLLFSSPSCFEWVEGQEDSTQWPELVEFFETSYLEGLEVDAGLAYTIELIEETRRHFNKLSLPRVNIVRPILEMSPEFVSLVKHHPAWNSMREAQPFKSPGWKIGLRNSAFGSARFSRTHSASMQERKNGWRDAVMATRKTFLEGKSKWMLPSAKIEWANRAHFLAEILSSSDPWIDQTRLADLINFDNCPACSLYLNALWLYAKNLPDKGPNDNDADDWLQVPAIAYADFSLVEKKLRNHLVSHLPKGMQGTPQLATRIFSDPVKFAERLRLS